MYLLRLLNVTLFFHVVSRFQYKHYRLSKSVFENHIERAAHAAIVYFGCTMYSSAFNENLLLLRVAVHMDNKRHYLQLLLRPYIAIH
jgi:hypothetical protein